MMQSTAETPMMVTHLYAARLLNAERKSALYLGKASKPATGRPCQFCGDTAPPPWARFAITKSWYGDKFTDYNRMTHPDSWVICAACAFAIKNGRRGWILTTDEAITLKPSSPAWSTWFQQPPEPPFAFVLNPVKLRDRRLTADGAKPRHLLLSARVAYDREEYPVSFGAHELAWIRRADAVGVHTHLQAIVADAQHAGLTSKAKVPQFLTAVTMRWLKDQPAVSRWPETVQAHYGALPRLDPLPRAVLEFAMRRAILADAASSTSDAKGARR